jgi:hypothetical protein
MIAIFFSLQYLAVEFLCLQTPKDLHSPTDPATSLEKLNCYIHTYDCSQRSSIPSLSRETEEQKQEMGEKRKKRN